MKRMKLLSSLVMCVFCLSFLVVGVWATASTALFNINGNLKFYPEGLFVQLSGEIYRGNSSTESEMTKLSDPRFTYGPVANFDNTLDELSGNFPLEAWDIGSVTFIPNQRFIKIKVYITNYSEFAIMGTPIVSIGGQDISETITGLTITSNASELSSITSNSNVTYELALQFTGSSVFSKNISISFEFEELVGYIANYDYFIINENSEIIGLTDLYTSDSPDTLVIPGITKDGLNICIPDYAFPGGSGGSLSPFYFAYIYGNLSNIIVFKDGITKIGDYAFWGTSITTIILESITPPLLGRGVFGDFITLDQIYVPAESVEAYRTASGWSDYAYLISAIE